jgi:hypothetical protein
MAMNRYATSLLMIALVRVFFLPASAFADRTLDGYIGGGTSCSYLKDGYETTAQGVAGEYERKEYHRQFKVVARGNRLFKEGIYDHVYNH